MTQQQLTRKACLLLARAQRIRQTYVLGRLRPALHDWHTTRAARLMVDSHLQARREREARVACQDSALYVRTWTA